MKFLFYIPHDANAHTTWDGAMVRDKGVGVSGTHLATIVAAEQLAASDPNNKCTVLYNGNNKIANGVWYPARDADLRGMRYEVLCIPSWTGENMLSRQRVVQLLEGNPIGRIIVWFHCPYCMPAMQEFLVAIKQGLGRDISIDYLHIASWSARNVKRMLEGNRVINNSSTRHYIIPNPLMDDVLPALTTVQLSKPQKDFVFIASIERGGGVAQNVHNILRGRDKSWGSFITHDYTKKDVQLDKVGVYEALKGARYFLYPLVLPSGKVHRDTFGCCVAEAIAMGVEVVSYQIGALPEHFGDMIHWLPLPGGLNTEYFNENIDDRFVTELVSDEQIGVIVAFMEELDMTYESRRQKRLQDMIMVRNKFSSVNIGELWCCI